MILSLQLDTITPTVNGIALNGQTAAYFPAFEPSDPRPSQHRGYYFSANQYMQLPPSFVGSGTPLILPTSLTFAIWLRPQGSGVLYTKENILQFSLSGSRQLIIQGGSPLFTYTHTSSLPLDVWVYLAVSISFSSSTGLTSITVYLDGSPVGVVYTSETYIKDDSSTATQLIGAAADLTDFYSGFIWKVVICNYVSSIVTTDFAGFNQPSGISFQLSPCPFLQTINCAVCDIGCSYGCIRTTDCSLCVDQLCKFCHDFVGCDQCVENASLQSNTTCTCKSGTYLAESTCKPCPAGCSICTSPTVCSSCSSGKYITPSTECVACDPNCLTCTSAAVCQSCFSGALLDSAGKCFCAPSYYAKSSASNCVPCISPCLTCLSATACLSCPSNTRLLNFTCKCAPGYYGPAESCLVCPQLCEVCTGDSCLKCFNGYFAVESQCLEHCPVGFFEDLEQWVCHYKPGSSVAASTEVTINNTVILTFAQPLTPQLQLSDLEITLTDSSGNIYHVTVLFAELLANQTYELKITIEGGYLPPENQLNITLLHSDTYFDAAGNGLETNTFSLRLHPLDATTDSVYSPVLSRAQSAASNSLLAGGLTTSLLAGNLATIYSLINIVQMITYFPLSTVQLPDNLRALMVSLNLQAYFPNPLAGSLGPVEGNAPEFARQYGYESATFLANAGVILISFCANLAAFPISWMLSKCKSTRIANHAKRILRGYRWESLMMHWIEAYLDLSVAALLQLRAVLTI